MFKTGDKVIALRSTPTINKGDEHTVLKVFVDGVVLLEGLPDNVFDIDFFKWIETTPQVHADLIQKWEEGAEIQCLQKGGFQVWSTISTPAWNKDCTYRVKPEPATIRSLLLEVYCEQNKIQLAESKIDLLQERIKELTND